MKAMIFAPQEWSPGASGATLLFTPYSEPMPKRTASTTGYSGVNRKVDSHGVCAGDYVST
jgi:hypothetical protein